eukprot:scaffold1640_cov161-Amphora_coffeaeformis.AAC.45
MNSQTFPTWTFDKACPSMEWTPLSAVSVTLTANVTADQLSSTDLVILPVESSPSGSEDKEPSSALELKTLATQMDSAVTAGALSEVLQEHAKALAKRGGTSPAVRVIVGGGKTQKYMLLAVGSADDDLKGAGWALGKAIAASCIAEKKLGTVTVVLPETYATHETVMTDVVTAVYQSLYADNRFRSKKKPVAEDLTAITFASEGSICDASVVVETGKMLAQGVIMAKDIINAPHNVLNSESLAETAKRIAAESKDGTMTCTILDKTECEKRGMGAYLGVARGSETEPQFIHMTYKPVDGNVRRKVALVGKGLLFDTGGYNIKTQMMELMKFDCGGSAAVLGAARSISQLCPAGVEVHFIVAACENMINDKAYVPSDILTASNGLTIEVMNTDAEGRLTLADALVYADKEVQAEKIVEFSTLTGACMISLGKQIAGVWTDSDDLAAELDAASKATGDKTWRMPMAHEYAEQLESPFADLKNLGTRFGGSITAALFLTNFVEKGKPFGHVDCAGPIWEDGKGATGWGSKLIVEWVKQQGQA